MADEEAARKETRKSEIRAEIGLLAKERDGLAELGADYSDEEYSKILARIEGLKKEYATL